jgi:hypothetical protein
MISMSGLREDRPPGDTPELVQVVLLGQSTYYLLTGAWALLDIASFQRVTGPKVDTWLVKMVGALVVVIGAVLGMGARHRRVSAELATLGIGSAVAFTAVDVFYAARRRISPVYLLDALAELFLITIWTFALKRRGTENASIRIEH